MKSSRKLALRREILTELENVELNGVAGAAPPTRYCGQSLPCDLSNTCFSCYTYISCNPLACMTRPIASVPECIVITVDTAC